MKVPSAGIFVFLLFSSTIVLSPLRTPGQDQGAGASQINLFPVFGSDPGEFIGLSLINTSAAKNDVAVTWTDAEGKSARTGFLSLAPASQRALLVKEILEIPADPGQGWIRIDSSEPGLLSYLSSGQDGILDAAAPVSLASTKIFLPHVSVDTGFMELDYTDTRIHLVNPGNAPANARAELVGLDSLSAGELMIPLPARASRTFRVSEAFRDALPPNQAGGRTFRGYMRVSSDMGLAGWLQIDTPLSRRTLRGFGLEEVVPERQLMVSHFVSGSPAQFRSELNLINAGDVPVTLEIVAQDDRGAGIGQAANRTLGPGQAFREDVLSLFRVAAVAVFPPPTIAGYIRIRASDGGVVPLVGNINITTAANSAAMLYPLEAASSFRVILPFIIDNLDFFTGYAIANSNELLTVQTDITIELLDPDGQPAVPPRKVSLAPATRFVSLVEEKVRSGYIRITANGPIAVLGSIGSRSGNTLAPLPGLR